MLVTRRGRPNVWQRVARSLAGMFGIGPQPETTQRGENFDLNVVTLWRRLREYEIDETPVRDARNIRLYAEMDAHFAFVSAALDMLSEDAVTDERGRVRGFRIETDSDELSQRLATSPALARMSQEGARFIRSALKYGDAFLELIAPKRSRVTGLLGLKELYAGHMFRIEDRFGRLQRFEQRREPDDSNPIIFEPAQIVHIRNAPSATSPYGRSILKSVRQDWKEFKDLTADIAIAGRTRAASRLVHWFKRSDRIKFARYLRKLETNRAAAIDTDIIVGRDELDSIEVLSGDAGIVQALMEREKHLEDRFAVALQVPKIILGIDTDIRGRDVSFTAERAYLRRLNGIRQMYTRAVMQVIVTELALSEGLVDSLVREGVLTESIELLQIMPIDGGRNGGPRESVFGICCDQLDERLRKLLAGVRVVWPPIALETPSEIVNRLAVAVEKLQLSTQTALIEAGYDPELERRRRAGIE